MLSNMVILLFFFKSRNYKFDLSEHVSRISFSKFSISFSFYFHARIETNHQTEKYKLTRRNKEKLIFNKLFC